MFDTHFDLLTILYLAYINNDFSYIKKLVYYFKKNKYKGLIANLYFMSIREMKEELGNYFTDPISMFKISTSLCKKYFKDYKIYYSIEGADYINTCDLQSLKEMGLSSILIVWNNLNKYGGGAKSKSKLTNLGKDFIKECMRLNLYIDLSHTNKRTFYDIYKLLKKHNYNKVIVSHSNYYGLCKNRRNINKYQIKCIKKLNGLIGLNMFNQFIDNKAINIELLRKKYLKHIKYMIKYRGLDGVSIATDNMMFFKLLNKDYKYLELFDLKNIKYDLESLLRNLFDKNETEKILNNNAYYFMEGD